MGKPMLQLILKKLQLPKTPRMIPKTLKQDNVDADAVADVARHAATTSTTTTAITPTTTTAAITNTTPATITATTTAVTTRSTTATNTSHVVTLVAVDVD